MSVPNTGDILQCGLNFAYGGTATALGQRYTVTDTAYGSGLDVVATVPASADTTTWPGNTVYSFYQMFWWATNNDTVDHTLHLLIAYDGAYVEADAISLTVPAGDTVPILHGIRVGQTTTIPINAWCSTTGVINIIGHTTRVVHSSSAT